MSLKNYVIPNRIIELSDGVSFTVRGLSLPQITHLVTKHAEQVKRLFDQANIDGSGLNLAQMESIGIEILSSAPDLAAEIIAVAAGEEDSIDVIRSLPFPASVAALEGIADLTFDSAGGPKKLLETVIRLFTGTSSFISDLRRSKSGSVLSAAK